MPNAARLADPVGHSPTMSWLLKGLLIGAGIALAAVLIAGTGGLAAAALVGGAAATGAGIGEVLGTMSWAPKDITGQIAPPCSANVFTNSLPAARAHLDKAACSSHLSPPPPIATGSDSVFINGLPAARVGDQIACSAVIVAGSPNVFIGGGTIQTDVIAPEDLVPPWVHGTLLVIGLASALILAGPVVAIGGLGAGMLGSIGGERLGGALFGQGSDGQKWTMLGGAFMGGAAGAKGAPKAWGFAKRVHVEIEPGTLGMSGGNVKIGLKPLEGKYKTTPMDKEYETEHIAGNQAPAWKGSPVQVQVKYVPPARQATNQLHFKDGKAYDAQGKLFDSSKSKGGEAIFVMDEGGNIYASNNAQIWEFHHSSLLAGKPVAAAGHIGVTEGEIQFISDRSGHYKPTIELMNQFLQELTRKGIDIRWIFYHFE